MVVWWNQSIAPNFQNPKKTNLGSSQKSVEHTRWAGQAVNKVYMHYAIMPGGFWSYKFGGTKVAKLIIKINMVVESTDIHLCAKKNIKLVCTV